MGKHVNPMIVWQRNNKIGKSSKVLKKNKCIVSQTEELISSRKNNKHKNVDDLCISQDVIDSIKLPVYGVDTGIYDCLPYEEV